MPLTNTKIRTIKPSTTPLKLSDEKGLYLLVTPTGGKWWRLDYRFSGKRKTLSMGVYPDVSLRDARDRRDTARKLLADGMDPAENRKAQKSARSDRATNSFEVITREWYAKHAPNWAEHHSDRIIQRFERDIFPWIGGGGKLMSCSTHIKSLANERRAGLSNSTTLQVKFLCSLLGCGFPSF